MLQPDPGRQPRLQRECGRPLPGPYLAQAVQEEQALVRVQVRGVQLAGQSQASSCRQLHRKPHHGSAALPLCQFRCAQGQIGMSLIGPDGSQGLLLCRQEWAHPWQLMPSMHGDVLCQVVRIPRWVCSHCLGATAQSCITGTSKKGLELGRPCCSMPNWGYQRSCRPGLQT